MDHKKIAKDLYDLSEETIYPILNKFQDNQMVDKSLVYCFVKAFYLKAVKLHLQDNSNFELLYLAYKENLKTYYKMNNPAIENQILDQILNFFDNSFALIESVEWNDLEDSYEFRHYTIKVFELLRMILEKNSQAVIRGNIFENDIKILIENTDKILQYLENKK